MRRDDWILGNGVCAGTTAVTEDGRICEVLKVKGRTSAGEAGNVHLREIGTGETFWVLGSKVRLHQEDASPKENDPGG